MPAKKKTKKKQTKPKPKPKAKPKAKSKAKLKAKLKVKPKAKSKVKPRKKKAVAKRRSGPTEFSVGRAESHPRNLSGDLQGLSRKEGAESESVAELLEEGNTFEAEVLSGVEAADSEEREVETHEVPEDDVPGEYLDED
jgi:hypothetical protein